MTFTERARSASGCAVLARWRVPRCHAPSRATRGGDAHSPQVSAFASTTGRVLGAAVGTALRGWIVGDPAALGAHPLELAGRLTTLLPAARGRALVMGAVSLLLAHHAAPQQREGLREQTGHVHLGDPDLLGDLGLGHVPEKAQQQDGPFTFGQLIE